MTDSPWGVVAAVVPPLLGAAGYYFRSKSTGPHDSLKESIEALERLRSTPKYFRSESIRVSIKQMEALIKVQTSELSRPKKSWSPGATQTGMLIGIASLFGLMLLGASQKVIPWDTFVWLAFAYLCVGILIGGMALIADTVIKTPDQLRAKNKRLTQQVESLSATRVVGPETRRIIMKKQRKIAENERKIVERTRA